MIRCHEQSQQATRQATDAAHELEMFFDGDCPLCAKEVAWIRWLDRRGRIRFTDIADPNFDPSAYGKSFEDFMSQMHARRSDGVWVTGVEVFRQLYSLVGFRWLVAPTRLPGVSWVLDCGYTLLAHNRLRLTGRCARGSCQVPRAGGQASEAESETGAKE
jgi:predicted DCC family thiol-disulfide oxidoreductase YuxK